MIPDPHPDQPAKPIRLVLGERASAALSSVGENAFVVITRATTDDPPGRWAMHILPTDIKSVNDAVQVATGRAKARRIKSK